MRPFVTFGVGLFFFFAGSSGEGDALRFLPDLFASIFDVSMKVF